MEEFIHNTDIICQVLVPEKSTAQIYAVLHEFIPGYKALNPDYAVKPDDEEYIFSSEEEMISYFVDTPNIDQSFYWNQLANNPDRLMVGVRMLKDNQTVFSLTFDGTPETEARYYLNLKKFLNSNIGVISYFKPVEYMSGADFEQQYGGIIYEFEI